MKKFEIGKTYACSSACDSECVWTFSVIRRTAKTVTFRTKYGEEKTCRINDKVSGYRNVESVFPLGRYSMAPLLDADDECMSPEEAARVAQEEEEARQAEIKARYEREFSESMKIITEASTRYPLVNDAPYVEIEWSERPGLEEGQLLSIPAAERVLTQLDQLRADRNQRENRGGYDKTSFVVHYTDADGEPSTYSGRYDLGDDDGGMIAHIRAYGEWLKTVPGEDHAQKGDEIIALADQFDRLCTVLPGRVLSFADAHKRKQAESAEAGALAAEFLLDLITAAAKAVPEQKPQQKRSGVVIPLF